jgi:hypothetical protein
MALELTRMAPLLANGICTVQVMAIRTIDPLGLGPCSLPSARRRSWKRCAWFRIARRSV